MKTSLILGLALTLSGCSTLYGTEPWGANSPTANELISMLKLTSLCLVIGLPELLTTAQLIYGRNFQQIPLLIVASIWYLVLTSILTFGQARLERRMSRGVLPAQSSRKRALATPRGEHL